MGWGLLAGAGIGLFFTGLNRAGSGTDLWPLAVAELTAVAMVLGMGAVTRQLRLPPPGTRWLSLLTGITAAAGTLSYFVATHHGLLAVTAVITTLYPAGTILLARVLLGERLTALRITGLGLAAASVSLIAAAGPASQRKYRRLSATDSAGWELDQVAVQGHLRRSPLSTSTCPSRLLRIIVGRADAAGAADGDPAPAGRHPVAHRPAAAAALTNATDRSAGVAPCAPNCGPSTSGSQRVDGRVRVPGDAVGREAGLEHELRLGAEELGPPQHDVGELARARASRSRARARARSPG